MDLLIVSDDHDPPASASAASVDDDRIYINLCDANIIPASPNPPHNNVVLLSDSQLLDAMEAELRLAYKMVEDLKQAPRIKSNNSRSRRGMNGNSRRSGSSEAMALNIAKPCCFCSSTAAAAAMASPENLMSMSMNGSDQFPSPDSTAQMRSATTTPRRSSSFSSTSTSSSSPSSSRLLLSNLTVAQKLFDTRMETVSAGLNPDGLMLAVDKFLSSPNYS